ncbi:MAG: hypothetical protein MPK62_00885 [Alphaproteobacteria bacterium]|nr:hypothetical protein [Alphaproteobacteria bacterium]MDA8029689.1 hypothetical protein [Alphaproteobacteria bacterium]
MIADLCIESRIQGPSGPVGLCFFWPGRWTSAEIDATVSHFKAGAGRYGHTEGWKKLNHLVLVNLGRSGDGRLRVGFTPYTGRDTYMAEGETFVEVAG